MFDGDIYYMQSVSSKALRLTSTDQERRVVNGLSDWTYEGGLSPEPFRVVEERGRNDDVHPLLKQRKCC